MKNDLSVLDHLQIDPVTLKISGACNWEIDPVETGKRLRSLRLGSSLSQECISALICANCAEGATKNTVRLWETGKKLPSRDHLYFLARLYGVSIDALVLSYDQVPPEPDGERDQPSPFHRKMKSRLLCRRLPFFLFCRIAGKYHTCGGRFFARSHAIN